MAITRSQKINLGIFVSASLFILIAAIIFLVGISFWEKKDEYTIRFSSKKVSLSGLDVGSPVKYSGIQIGRVSSITIDPQDVSIILVKLETEADTPIAEDSAATLGSIGITGLKYIELSRGSAEARVRSSGEEIPSGPSFIDEITGKASIIANKTELLLNQLNKLIADDHQKKFWDTVTNIQELAKTTNDTIEKTSPELQNLSIKLNVLANELEGTVSAFREFFSKSAPELTEVFRSTNNLIEGINATRNKLDGLIEESRTVMVSLHTNLGDDGVQQTVTKLNSFLDQCSLMLKQSEEEITLTLEHLRETSENLDEFSILIKENPSLLLRSPETQEREID